MSKESLPHWDLTNVYPSLESNEFQQAVTQARVEIEELDRYLSSKQLGRGGPVPKEPPELAEVMAGYLERMNALVRLIATLRAYIASFVATDSYNTAARRLMSELEPMLVHLDHQEVLFQGWLGTAAEQEGRFEAALAVEGPAKAHSFYLHQAAEQSRYLMSEAEEALAAELSISGIRAWGKLQGVITSQLKVSFERDGKIETLPMTILQNLRSDLDETVRRRAHEAELAAWEGVREPLAACMNGVKGMVVTLNEKRGRSDALHEALDQARIDRQTLEAMLGAMRGSFPAFQRYFQTKARLLGKDTLAWWDLFAPVGSFEKRYTYAETQEFILEQFSTFSDRLVSFSRHAFDHNWIDAEPRDGKRGGAFCMVLPAVEESRILCNFDGSLDQVSTIAHELGHGYHNACQAGKEPLQRRTPMTLAETASIFNQTIITDALLAHAASPQEELAILEGFLSDAAQVIVDISSRFLFEKEVFERRAQAELSADDFCEIMARAQKETYGTGLDHRTLHPYMWAWKPHYYRPDLSFYNFPYAFGMLFGLGLYAIYQDRGRAFLPEYDELLRSTGEGTAAEMATRFGIDIRQRSFWETSLTVIEERIERYQAL
ncbi:MAG: M3 family oligoendopeptidase [Anaerolineae bacterium]|jgi:pepF/M3 family oligoendopeptidase